jgi:hypothetical protein
MSNYDNKIRLYALADPRALVEENDAIAKFVFEVLQVSPSTRRRVNISPSSGWLDYTALDELWERSAPPALPSQTVALKAAEGLLTRLEQKCSDANRAWPERLRGISLLPPVGQLRRIGLNAVMRPDGSTWDHWLYRAEPQLTLDGGSKTRAGVFGAQIEVRIGQGGQPIGVHSRWTPLSGERKFTDLSPFRPSPGDEGSDTTGNSDPIIKYLLQGAGIPQYYLAPYYFGGDNSDPNMSSASPYSLTVDIVRTKQSKGRMTLAALARGGSGDYLYNWALCSLTRVEKGVREIGRGNSQTIDSIDGRTTLNSIEVGNGSYVVLLNVQDRATGAFKHQQQQIFSSPFPSEASDTPALQVA